MMKALNILVFTWRDIKNPEAGGVEVRLYELCRRLIKEGHKVTFLCSGFKNANLQDKINGINIIRISSKYIFSFSAFFYYVRNLRKNNYDLVIEEMNKVPFFTPLFVHGPRLACYSQLNEKIFFQELIFPFSLVAYFMERVLMPWVYKGERFMVASKSTLNELRKLGVAKKNMFVVYNGLNHQNFRPIPFKKKKKHQLVVVGRLKKYKGVQHLISVMPELIKQFPELKLNVVGRGSYEKKLKQLAKQHGLIKNVIFLGFINNQKKTRLLQESSLLIHPSYKEGWGINIIEANACGTPVIACDVSGLRDSVINKKTGLLVDYGDVSSLKKAIIKLLKNDKIREKMSLNSIKHAKAFDWNKSYISFLKLVKKIVNDVAKNEK